MKYIGIDLAWKVRPAPNEKRTAIVALDDGGRVIFYDHCSNDEEIIDHVDKQAEGKYIVGIDAPLVVPTLTRGCRDCEVYSNLKLLIYPTDPSRFLKWYGGCRGVVIVKKLQDLNHGFFLVDRLPTSIGKAVVEVYPTGSWKRLFGRTPKFKRIRVEEKRKALLKVKNLLKAGIPPCYPPVELGSSIKQRKSFNNSLARASTFTGMPWTPSYRPTRFFYGPRSQASARWWGPWRAGSYSSPGPRWNPSRRGMDKSIIGASRPPSS